jgi:hypothetical protein
MAVNYGGRPAGNRTANDQPGGEIDVSTIPALTRTDVRRPARGSGPPVNLGGAALCYARIGLAVFPLQARSKIPTRGSHGCKDATTDEDRIIEWWTRRPDANIGIATGRLVDVVDIDGRTGRTSERHNRELFATLTVYGRVNTPRPGSHLYVPAQGVGNKAGLLPGIDYRGIGGYVVAPPSVTDVGAYAWTVPLSFPAVSNV